MNQNGNQPDQPCPDASSSPQQVRQLAEACGLEVVDLEHLQIDRELLSRFSAQQLFQHRVLPVSAENGRVRIAVCDPFQLEGLDELRSTIGCPLETVWASEEQIHQQLTRYLGVGGQAVDALLLQHSTNEAVAPAQIDVENDEPQSASVVALVNELLNEAIRQRSSDIHLENDRDQLQVRYRIDGMLRLQPIPLEIHRFRNAIISRLKIMAGMNIAEKRRPQDGRLTYTIEHRAFDVRVSVLPMLHGEGVVMRLLDRTKSTIELDALDMPKELRQKWESLIRRPHGLVLVTGPTGSGKTTTLYSSLSEIQSMTTKIITVEDPIEYDLQGVNQIQVHEQVGLTFAAGLRSILRHDPDVVLIGEIRDAETATSAIQASLTGHQVLSTLHTNDATSAYTRLIDMGMEPYLVASTLQGILAQRLVRRLCENCRESYDPNEHELPIGRTCDQPIFRAIGCRDCCETGFLGRVAIFELFIPNETIRRMCLEKASPEEVRKVAIADGLITLLDSGWLRVLDGSTTISEIMRVCVSDADVAQPCQADLQDDARQIESSNAASKPIALNEKRDSPHSSFKSVQFRSEPAPSLESY